MTIWTKPKTVWQWLLLLLPAGLNIFGAVLGALFGVRSSTRGEWAVMGGVISIPVGAVLCLVIGCWLVRDSESVVWKIFGALIFALLLALVNAAIGFPGCMLVGATAGS